jgi:hypothetical protein
VSRWWNSGKEPDDGLSPEARRLKEQHERRTFSAGRDESRTTVGKVRHEVLGLTKFLGGVVTAATWLWWNFGNPLLNRVTIPLLVRFLGWYVRLWTRFTTVKDGYGNDKFSKVRGAMMIAGTFLSILAAPHLVLFTYDLGLYAVTRHEDQEVWLSSAQEIYPGSGTFSVQGCEVTDENSVGMVECNEVNSIYYRVEPNIFNNLWSLVAGRGIFFPDLVVSPIGADWSRCVTTTYGIRFRLLVFLGDVYPTLLAASCKRVEN